MGQSSQTDTGTASTWLTREEAAAYIRSTVGTLATWASRHMGPRCYNNGRLVRYRRADLDAWLMNGTETTTDEEGTEA